MTTRSSTLTPDQTLDPQATIIALASPQGPGARAILRLTGVHLHPLLERSGLVPTHRRQHIAWRLPSVTTPLPVEILSWRGPRSYTGQDIVEIHLPGSPPLVQAVLEHLLASGMRLAQPGEFTLRAFLAGKLDLTQAEAVHGLISATTPDELRTALAQMAGGLARPLEKVREELLHLLAEVEAGLDFAEEDLSFIHAAELTRRLEVSRRHVEETLSHLHQRRTADRPFRVVLVGLPNAGKSSLLNALAGKEAALVSPQAGTTRDYVSVRINVAEMVFEVADTAGLEEVAAFTESIPAQAQAARQEQMQQADLLLLCFDCQDPVPEALRAMLQSPASVPILSLWTKCDLPHMLETMPEAGWLRTSATTGKGLGDLRARLAEHARQHRHAGALAPSLTRCRTHLEACGDHLQEAEQLARHQGYPELLALELRLALDDLGRIVGAVYTEDLLDRVFGQFCIGK
jgi:tRNA modification GTPase